MWIKTATVLVVVNAQTYTCPSDDMQYSIGYQIPATFTTADYNPDAILTLTFTKADGTTHEV